MRLSMETYGLRRRYGDFEAARLIREAGFDCVDYSCYYWKEQAHALGVGRGIDPFMTLSFMALPVIPSLRITTRGVFDVNSQSYV